MSSKEDAAFFKVLIVGDGAVGKTSICTHITTQEFFADYHLTVGCDFFIKRLYVNNISVTLQIFDIGGQDHFARMRSAFADGAKGIFLAYDVTRRDSFYGLERWIESVKDGLDPKAPQVLIATKSDLKVEAEVWEDDVNNMKGLLNFDAFFDTSSLTGDGVPEAFETMAMLLLARYKPDEYLRSSQQEKFVEGFYRA